MQTYSGGAVFTPYYKARVCLYHMKFSLCFDGVEQIFVQTIKDEPKCPWTPTMTHCSHSHMTCGLSLVKYIAF